MIIPSFEQIREVTDSRYSLVILVSKRAKLIVDGEKPFVETKSKKPVSIAIEEVLNKDVIFGEPMSNKDYDEKIEAERTRKLEFLHEQKERERELMSFEKDAE